MSSNSASGNLCNYKPGISLAGEGTDKATKSIGLNDIKRKKEEPGRRSVDFCVYEGLCVLIGQLRYADTQCVRQRQAASASTSRR